MIKHDHEDLAGARRTGTRAGSLRRKSWPLEIYMLGQCEIRVDGVALLKRRKTPHRLLELLKVIVASGGAAVPVSYLIDQLWPESDGDQAVATFSKTLKRLRKYLTVERVIHLEHGTVTLDSMRSWVDVCAFEQGVTRSEHISSSLRVGGWARELEQALALYRGPFLLDQRLKPWAVATRERLRERFVAAVTRSIGTGNPMVESRPSDRPARCAALRAAYHASFRHGPKNRSRRRLSPVRSSIPERNGTSHSTGRPAIVHEYPSLELRLLLLLGEFDHRSSFLRASEDGQS